MGLKPLYRNSNRHIYNSNFLRKILMMKFSLKTLTLLALLVAVHLANVTCQLGYHFKDTYDSNRSNRWTSGRTLNRYCMSNDYGCKNYNGQTGFCLKCEDGYDKKKDFLSGDYCVMGWGMIWIIVGCVAGGILLICIFCCVCAACCGAESQENKKLNKSKKNKDRSFESGQGYGQPPQSFNTQAGYGPQGGFQQGYQGGYQQGNQGGYQQGNQGGYQQGNQGGYQQGY
jgi:hypothetical protein